MSAIPSRLSDDGLVVTVLSEDGRDQHRVSFRTWEAPETLLRQVALGLHALTSQHGTWKSVETSKSTPSRWLHLVRFCNSVEVETLDDFTPQHWADLVSILKERSVKTSSAHSIIVACRALLLAHPTLLPATRDAVREKFFLPEDNRDQPHYTLDEFKTLRAASRRVLREETGRISGNWALARLPRNEVPAEELARWSGLNKILDGGLPTTRTEWLATGIFTEADGRNVRAEAGMRKALATLFLGPDEVIAAMVAMVCETGENFSTLAKRDVPSTASTAGDQDLTVFSSDLDKARRGPTLRHMRENASRTDGHGRVLSQIIAATEPAREAARRQGLRDPQRLLWCFDRKTGRVHSQVGKDGVQARRHQAEWLKAAPQLDFKTLRRTYVNRIGSREVHHSARRRVETYLSSDPEHQDEWAATAAAGLEALFEEAEATFVRILSREEAATRGVLTQPPQGDFTPSGMRCRDSDHHPQTGEPCDDDFLCCLGCANAFATEDHLPLLVALYDLLEQARQATGAGVWERRFQVAWARLTVMLRNLSEEQWTQARSSRTQDMYDLAYAVVESREYEI